VNRTYELIRAPLIGILFKEDAPSAPGSEGENGGRCTKKEKEREINWGIDREKIEGGGEERTGKEG
jgi:hypothetical protein